MIIKKCDICGQEKPIIGRLCWSKEDPTPILEWCEDCDMSQ